MNVFAALAPLTSALPETWEVLPLRRVMSLREEANTRGAADLLSLRSDGCVVERDETTQPPAPEYLPKYRRVAPGDLVVNPMWLAGGGIGVTSVYGAVSPDYRVYRPSDRLSPRFVHHVMRSAPYLAQYRLLMRAETTFDRRVTKDDFRDIPIPVPPRRVQEQISVALDAETTRIDALIEKKRRMVEVLREQRRGLITATVTGDRADEFSESPGDADAWPSYRLKFLVGINERTLTEDCHPDYEFRYVDIGLVGRGSLVNDEPVLLRFGDAPSRARRILRRGDTIISTVRTYLRAVWSVAGQWDAPLVASTGFAVLSPGPKLDADYLGWWAQSDACIDNVVARSTGVSYPALSANEIGNLTIALPPLSDQRRLAALLAARVSQIDSLISTLNLQVDLLLDYRQTLITRVVTGQLDLAEAA